MCAIGETFSHYNAAETKHKSLNWTVKTETTTTCGDTNITTVDTGGCSGLPACTTFSVLQYKQNTAAILMQNTVAGNTNRTQQLLSCRTQWQGTQTECLLKFSQCYTLNIPHSCRMPSTFPATLFTVHRSG